MESMLSRKAAYVESQLVGNIVEDMVVTGVIVVSVVVGVVVIDVVCVVIVVLSDIVEVDEGSNKHPLKTSLVFIAKLFI